MVSVKIASYLLWWRHNLVPSDFSLENGRKQKWKSTGNEVDGGILVATRPVANLSDINKIYESLYFCWTLIFLRKYRHRNDTI